MKFKIIVLLFFIISIYTMGIVRAYNLPLLGKVIYLDPGHGGKDPGALAGNVRESDLNLEISLKIQSELEKNGAIVYLTRYGDYDLSVNNAILRKRSDLSRRANIINASNANLYLSIHLNADSSSTWRGAQVFYEDVNKENEVIAKIFQEQFAKDLNTKRNYKKLTNQYMYKRINIPGVLLEVGFITNPTERYLLVKDSYQEKIASSTAKSVIKYLTSN